MATKKIAPKKAPVKVTAKKTATKPVSKPATKKAVVKPAPKKIAPTKPVAKKVAAPAKKAAKVAPKPVAKKAAPTKPQPKPTAKKIAPKKAVEKQPISKKALTLKPETKVASKPTKQVVEKKIIKTEPKKDKKTILKDEKVIKVKEDKVVKVKEEKVVKLKEEKVAKEAKPEKVKAEKPVKVKKTKVKKPKRIIRTSKPPKPVKALGIEKATTVIPIKKIVPKVKDEPVNKNFKVPKITTKSSVAYSSGYVPMDKRKEDDEPQIPMVRYGDNELNEFRELITRKVEIAKKELAYLQGVINRKDDMGGGAQDEGRYMTLEDGSMSMEREQMSNMASRQYTFIDHLEKALQRIEAKTYGICRVTGKLIDKARLRAVPHATLSLEAKLGLVKAGE